MQTRQLRQEMKVPFLDLPAQHRGLKEELVQVFADAVDHAAFVGGAWLEAFEEGFAALTSCKFALGASSGTDALVLALKAVGVEAGDTVITVPNTFIATTEAISQVGGRIGLVDIDPGSCLMDVGLLSEQVEAVQKSGGRVGAVVPVHLYGQMVDMDRIMDLAVKHGFKVVEDACQAHGASYKGRRAGSIGHAAAFSFYPGKNLGALGEGGAVTTNDATVADSVRILRDHGQEKKYHHRVEGYNGRLDAIQAGFLTVKLRYILDWNEKRRAVAARYDEAFSAVDWTTPVRQLADNLSSCHLYVVHVDDREGLAEHLTAAGVGNALHYPIALHRQPAYAHLGLPEGSFPHAEYSAAHLLSLPMFPELTGDQIEYVIASVLAYRG